MNCSDQITRRTEGVTDGLTADAGRVLAALANHFAGTNPLDALDDLALMISIGAEAHKQCGGMAGGRSPAVARMVLDAAPERAPGVTRGEYALLLRESAAVYGWTDEDNKRVIPIIPGPRPASVTGRA